MNKNLIKLINYIIFDQNCNDIVATNHREISSVLMQLPANYRTIYRTSRQIGNLNSLRASFQFRNIFDNKFESMK